MTKNIESKKDIIRIPFTSISKKNREVRMGLVVLETDLTLETEMRYYLSTEEKSEKPISLIHTRIPCDDHVTEENLKLMETRFGGALSLLPKNYEFDVIGYGCTSASLLIGEAKIEKTVKSFVDTRHVTTPMTAVKRGLTALKVKNIGYLAPYLSEISQEMCDNLVLNGWKIGSAATFGENRDSVVGNISPNSIFSGVIQMKRACKDLEAVFVACTSLKCSQIIDQIESELDIPVVSSNSAIAWDMARLSGANISSKGKGRLFRCTTI
ncbi:MAG: hypothetical protein VYE27_00215 [Pseudomonadota bacterium]|nr:hypothetical protein [Pseudomonadota bacterium]